MDEKIKAEIIHTAAFYEHRLRLGSKPIFHLDGSFFSSLALLIWLLTVVMKCTGFVAKVMSKTLIVSPSRLIFFH